MKKFIQVLVLVLFLFPFVSFADTTVSLDSRGCADGYKFSATTGKSCTATTECASGDLFSTVTGKSCSVPTNLPAGCTSTIGYSPTTGQQCNGMATYTTRQPLQTVSSATASIYTDLKNPSSSTTGIVKMIPVLMFDIKGQNDTLHIHSLTIHFTVDGIAQINTAYLYQGDTTPISSTSVSNNTATFLISDNTNGASFGANIPSQYTIKIDTTGTKLKYSIDDSRFSVYSSIDSSDVQLYDSLNNLVPVTGYTKGNILVTSGYCGPGCA